MWVRFWTLFWCQYLLPRLSNAWHEKAHSASLGRFVPHHASAMWRKAPLHRTIFRLNLEKKWLRPSACLQGQRLTGVIFIIHCSYLVIPKLYFIEIEVNSIKGKICTVLKWRHLSELFKGSALGFPYAVHRRPTASQMLGGDAYEWLWYARDQM